MPLFPQVSAKLQPREALISTTLEIQITYPQLFKSVSGFLVKTVERKRLLRQAFRGRGREGKGGEGRGREGREREGREREGMGLTLREGQTSQ